MATKKHAPRTRIEDIKTDLQLISTCTASTVAGLQGLLADESEEVAQKENVRARGSKLLSVQSSGRRKVASATATATTVPKESGPLFSPREKYILATEVANITLKSLADALKSQPTRAASKPGLSSRDDAPKVAMTRPTHSRSPSYTQKPLQERSISQAINSPIKPSSLRRSLSYSSCITTGLDLGLVATAECARAAFTYLRTPEAAKTAGRDSPVLQLENGILALIGKLVAHGLDNAAIRELRILKKRLDHYLGKERPGGENQPANARAGPKKTALAMEKESLASLLNFGDIDRKSPALPLVVSHQIYTLRMIARAHRPRLVEEAWDFLKLSNPYSPGNLIWQVAKASNGDPKMVRQLESFAQTILSLCPSISHSDDVAVDQGHLQPRPDLVFSLQHLAFKLRQRWWALAKHQGHEEKELLEPFSKCLVAFSRRSKVSAMKKYKVAELLLTDLLGSVDRSTLFQRHDNSASLSLAAKCLGSLAQSASLNDEALSWLQLSGSTEAPEESAATTAARTVRIATISLDASLKDPAGQDLRQAIENTLQALFNNLDGSTSEVDSLFMEVNTLRRTAARALQTKLQTDADPSKLITQELQIISASVHLSARYLNTSTSDATDSKARHRSKQRALIISKYLKSIVDSACVCSKLPVSSDSERHWKDTDTLLHDCLTILRHFEEHPENNIKLPDDLLYPLVKISNAYWTVHLQLKIAVGITEDTILAMQQSVVLLQDRPEAERHSGLLAMKLERLGEAFDSIGRIESSRDAFRRCIQSHIDSSVYDEAIELAAKFPVFQIFEGNGPASTLGRILKTYHRSYLKHGSDSATSSAFYDDVALSAVGRGLFLEWQLALFMNVLSRNRSWDTNLNASIWTISKTLLELYSRDRFPVRRLRVHIMLLQLASEHPDILSQELAHAVVNVDYSLSPCDSVDGGLARYHGHLQAFHRLKLCMQQSLPVMDDLNDCLSIWQALVDSASTWADICSQVDNIELWLTELHGLADFLSAKGGEYLCLTALRLLVKVHELEKSSDNSRLVTTLSTLGQQLVRLGYSGKSGMTFAKAETLASEGNSSTEAKLQWHIGYAEYLIVIGNIVKCESILVLAEDIAHSDADFLSLAKPSTTLSGRVRFNRVIADACYVHSLLSTKTGKHKAAARYAKQCVGLNRRIWTALESRSSSKQLAPPAGSDTEGDESGQAAFDPLSSMRNDKGMPLVMSATHASLNGPNFWFLVPRLYLGLMQQSQVFTYQGLLQEAIYIAEQAEKVVQATNSQSLAVDNSSRRAEYWALGGRVDKAQTVLETLDLPTPFVHLSMATYYSSMARICHYNAKYDDELATYQKLDALLSNLTLPSFTLQADPLARKVEDLTEKLANVKLEPEPKIKATVKATRGRKAALKVAPKTTSRSLSKPASKSARSPPVSTVYAADECSTLHNLRADMTLRKALTRLTQDNHTEALEILAQARSLEKGPERSNLHLWVTFKALLSQSMKELSSDFTFSTLPESTIAFPAVVQQECRLSEGSMTKRTNNTSTTIAKGGRGKKSSKEDFVATLREARDRLIESHNLCAQAGPNSAFQQSSFALGHITVLLSAVLGGGLQGSLHPLYAAYMSEIPKCNSLRLAQESVEVEQESLSREESLRWPLLDTCNQTTLSTASDLQQDYIDIIPKSWTAISLSLDENHEDLYITRYEAGVSPFVLRLPMSRHAFRDIDEDKFSFADGKREFEEIIELSDFSTRTAKDMTSREARLQWWTEREALDTKLHGLLLNIENIWLGGFRGIFSQHPRQPSLLARFRKSFDNILNRNLPSRRKKGARKASSLDARVLELFVGLGDATNDELDLDEALTDLIYFVVDILQFNGERNAYDEIDFDTIVIETLDALRAYHGTSEGASGISKHIILVLDRDLHAFPWESLPCLQSLSISRLPSLAALRERILVARLPIAAKDAQPGHHISAGTGGASVLNPSGDLTHTLKTLGPRLDDLQGDWTHIVSRAPTEKEFESALKEKDLVLYFGHGSGAQFIRSKSVRRLYPGSQAKHEKPVCATTFLFGCSSVHLTDNGIYEPSGMLASYLTAGAPAVVGMLWDVTDKDCDRFAVKAGELWGLWPEVKEEDSVIKTANRLKNKGKGKVAQLVDEVESARGSGTGKRAKRDRSRTVEDSDEMESADKQRRRGVGLDEAVREARDVCVLRYLNGAAAVVYGIPVYLE